MSPNNVLPEYAVVDIILNRLSNVESYSIKKKKDSELILIRHLFCIAEQ